MGAERWRCRARRLIAPALNTRRLCQCASAWSALYRHTHARDNNAEYILPEAAAVTAATSTPAQRQQLETVLPAKTTPQRHRGQPHKSRRRVQATIAAVGGGLHLQCAVGQWWSSPPTTRVTRPHRNSKLRRPRHRDPTPPHHTSTRETEMQSAYRHNHLQARHPTALAQLAQRRLRTAHQWLNTARTRQPSPCRTRDNRCRRRALAALLATRTHGAHRVYGCPVRAR